MRQLTLLQKIVFIDQGSISGRDSGATNFDMSSWAIIRQKFKYITNQFELFSEFVNMSMEFNQEYEYKILFCDLYVKIKESWETSSDDAFFKYSIKDGTIEPQFLVDLKSKLDYFAPFKDLDYENLANKIAPVIDNGTLSVGPMIKNGNVGM